MDHSEYGEPIKLSACFIAFRKSPERFNAPDFLINKHQCTYMDCVSTICPILVRFSNHMIKHLYNILLPASYHNPKFWQ